MKVFTHIDHTPSWVPVFRAQPDIDSQGAQRGIEEADTMLNVCKYRSRMIIVVF